MQDGKLTRTDILNEIVRAHGYRRYLEIGIRDPAANFLHILSPDKTGVDPAITAPNVWRMKSDEFFASLDAPPPRKPGRPRKREGGQEGGESVTVTTWDMIFVDGDHRYPAVQRDLANSLRHLAPGGTIVLHDCYPRSEEAALPEKPNTGRAWNGQAYLAFLEARQRPDLWTCCIDCDHGMGLVRFGRQKPIELPPTWAWQEYRAHSREWLGLVAVADMGKVL